MAGKGSVLINFAAKADDALREMKKVTRGLGDIDKKSDDAGGSLNKMKGLAVTGVAAVGAALVGAGAAMVDFADAAIKDWQEAEKLEDVLSRFPGVTDAAISANEDWISSMELATLVSDTQLRKSIGELMLATEDLTEAQQLAALATDISASSGKSMDSVVKTLVKAHEGNTAALKKQFPWLKTNKDGTLKFSDAVKQLGDKYKGAAEKAANRDPWNRLKTVWDQLKEQLGTWVIPLVEKFGEWFKDKKNQKALKDVITAVGDLASEMGDNLVPVLDDFLKLISGEKMRKSLKSFGEKIDGIRVFVEGVYKVFKPLYDICKAWLDIMYKLSGFEWLFNKMASAKNVSAPASSNGGRSAATTSQFSTTPTTIGSVTINLQGTGYTYKDAALIKRSLENYDRGQGRTVGAPLRLAW